MRRGRENDSSAGRGAGANRWRGEKEFKKNDHTPFREKMVVPYVHKVEIDPETHPEMVVMIKESY